MRDLLTPSDIERLARRAGIPMVELCRRADVAPSIFSRWKAGKTEPSLANYRRIRDAALSGATPKRRSRRGVAARPNPAPAAAAD